MLARNVHTLQFLTSLNSTRQVAISPPLRRYTFPTRQPAGEGRVAKTDDVKDKAVTSGTQQSLRTPRARACASAPQKRHKFGDPRLVESLGSIVDNGKPILKLIVPERVQFKSLRLWNTTDQGNENQDCVASLSTDWSTKYAAISETRIEQHLFDVHEDLIGLLLGRSNDRDATVKSWMLIPPSIRERYWHTMMLWALRNSPERALKLLDASIVTPQLRPARHVVEDCLNYLTTFYLKKSSVDPLIVDTLLRLVCNFAEASAARSAGFSSFPQPAVYLLLQHCKGQEIEALFATLCRHNMTLHPFTLFHFLGKFVDMGKIELSLEILRHLVITSANFTSDIFQSACVKLLRGPVHTENRYNIQSSILTQVLEAGIRPGIIMCNVIILNAIEAGDYQTAWHMFDLARENGLRPDATTYSIMLKGVKSNSNFDIIDHVIHNAEGQGHLPQDRWLVGDVLHAMFIKELVRNQENPFTALLRIYTRYCDVGPLRDLSLISDIVKTPLNFRRQVQSPSSWTIGLMIMAYIKQHQDSAHLAQRYTRYHKLVVEGHSLLAPTAQGDYIYNAFILALGRRPQSLRYCVDVIKDMLPSPREVHDAKPIKVAIPTVRTWSILAAAYFHHGQQLAAKKVLKMMEARGLRPNQVTWNIIIGGYSKLQDVDSAVQAVKDMEAAGFEADAHTLKGLGRFQDRSRMLEALKKATKLEEGAEYGASNPIGSSTSREGAPEQQPGMNYQLGLA